MKGTITMNAHANLLASLDAELVAAYVATPTKARAGRNDSPIKAEARALASEAKTLAAKAELDARDRKEERDYHRTIGRLASLGKRANAVTKELAKLGWVPEVKSSRATTVKTIEKARELRPTVVLSYDDKLRYSRLETLLKRIQRAQGVMFDQPINLAYDLAENGRYMRSIRYHGREVGMLAIDHADILSEALELCYRDREAITLTTVGGRGEVVVPKVGALYRKSKKAYQLALNRFREAGHGKIAVYSLDALKEFGVEATEKFDHYGYEYAATDTLDKLLMVDDVATEREALEEAHRRIVAEAAAEEARLRARMEAVDASAEVDRVNRIALKMIAAGATIKTVAGKLGITQATLVANLSKAEWRVPGNGAGPIGNRSLGRTIEPSTNGPVRVYRAGANGERIRVS